MGGEYKNIGHFLVVFILLAGCTSSVQTASYVDEIFRPSDGTELALFAQMPSYF